MEDGVWRTIGGRRVFIKTGQSLQEAMRESGKFKRKNLNEMNKQKYDKAKIEFVNGKVEVTLENGEKVNLINTREYTKLATQFADSLNEQETKLVQNYVDN